MFDPDNIGLNDENVPLTNRLAWRDYLSRQQGRAAINPRTVLIVSGIIAGFIMSILMN